MQDLYTTIHAFQVAGMLDTRKPKFVRLAASSRMSALDLEYGLPVQVKDTALNISPHDSIPKNDVNKEFFAEEHDRKV